MCDQCYRQYLDSGQAEHWSGDEGGDGGEGDDDDDGSGDGSRGGGGGGDGGGGGGSAGSGGDRVLGANEFACPHCDKKLTVIVE